MQLPDGVAITYLGHSTFTIRTPRGRVILIEPWLEGNPAVPEALKSPERVDICLITHGHFDHMADVLALHARTGCQIVTNYEISVWLGTKGVSDAIGLNKGGGVDLDGIRVTATKAEHSSSIADGDNPQIYAGEPLGFVIELENGFTVYDAGDTGPFGDMRLIAELYKPQLAILPIGDRFTAGPREAALMCRLLSSVHAVIPSHWGTFPLLTGTPEQLRALTTDIADFEVIALNPGDSLPR